MAGEDPDAVDLAAMPRQRRRREKKLMTMEEVNEKFPLTKYKTWRSTRAQEGLPTAGGINAAASRPASIKNLPRVSEDEDNEAITPRSPTALTEKITPSTANSPVVAQESKAVNNADKRPTTAVTETTTIQKTDTNEDEVETGDQIQTAVPTEQLPDPGDACAICIDSIEDDDDIRGLTCGHAFHASCVDPWLTSRRACCPLCKADYYTPKPRPEGEVAEEVRRRNTREEIPPPFTFMGGRGRGPQLAIFGRRFLGGPQAQASQQRDDINRRAREQSQATVGASPPEEFQAQQTSWRSRMNMPRLPAMTRIRNGSSSQAGQQAPSPSQLEAGQTATVR